MKKKLLTMAMAFGFAFLGGTTAMAAETQELPDEIVNYVVEEEEPGLYKIYEPEEGTVAKWDADNGLTKLPAPAWAKWDHSDVEGTATWAPVEEAEGRYRGVVYKNNEEVRNVTYSNYSSGNDILAKDIEESGSGTYYFKVCARGDGTANSDSDYTVSETFTYTQPDRQLGLVTNLRWSSETPAVAEWDAVENADGYYMELFCNGKRVMGWRSYNPDFLNCDVSLYMTEEGDYTFKVRALSARINTIRSGEYGDLSPAYKTANTVAIINNKLDEVLKRATENPAVISELLQEMGRTNLQIAMQTDVTARDKVQQLEEAYAEHNNIKVSNKVATELENKFDPSKIKVTGTALNAKEAGIDMSLNFSQPQQEIFLDDDVYKNTVQIDISLDGARDSGYLQVPMTMTVPIPEGISTGNFQIIHCHHDGTKEIIRPLIINKEERTATFTVLSFSTFVFANEKDGSPFNDVTTGDWFYDAVNYVYTNGIMSGVGNNNFNPLASTDRAMVVQILYNLEGKPGVSGSNRFSDVDAGAWYANAVQWAVENGITAGVSATEFAPERKVTRQEVASFLYRYANWKNYNVSGKNDLSAFADSDEVASWATEAMQWANNAKIINGTGSGLLAPTGTATRAEVAAMMKGFKTKY